ncbi:hypothetical protein GCM10007415_31080 [Parapedobacter pyrenivorans]|uniref:Uncharacterized protein n=1 Tax=Parapedobacter pyrenivorans TaxID=1305674 RepID=A0A917MCT4_9SPHI|nr:hypothetical protein GCM10007415_31080 [Parapedobacter pyrenivorans]
MSLGVFQAFQTFATGAFTVASTEILVTCAIVTNFCLLNFTIQNYDKEQNGDCSENDNLGGEL